MQQFPSILCIDDDRDAAELIAEDLSERGFTVDVAHDGGEGFSAIVRLHPDLVLCDLRMPTSGFELLKRLTDAAPRFLDMPFIFLSAAADRDIEIEARRLGADDFLAKPVDFDILAAIVRRRLDRVARGTPTARTHISPRESEVLTWAARGKTSAEIAIIMDLSKRTVDFHFDNARSKLGAISRIETVIRAATGGLITP